MSVLAAWHADPLDAAAARALLARAQQNQQRGNRQRRCRLCLLQEMIARYWLGENLEELRQHFGARLQRSAHARALLELVTGQLLLSRRLQGAHLHLQQGFRLAGHLFSADDYFSVLNRHQQLTHLPLGAVPLPAAPLPELITTAQIIQRMRHAVRVQGGHNPTDLHG